MADAVARRIAFVHGFGIEIDGGNARLGQAQHLACLANAVAVLILPHRQLRIDGILGINPAVLILIIGGQGGIAVGKGFLALGVQAVIAEELMAVIDAAVGILIQHQQGIGGINPSGLLGKAVAVEIEMHGFVQAFGQFGGMDAVAVQVDDDGGRSALGLVEGGVEVV
ncbi:Uncharacterised protein [Brevundimonas vesicularis]|uniref:Uncharacterized protein n=1 Tax=Brevundimonas vesicularis TaxID=41276 RepID=A0A2X1DF18_BREVE|nr:Uncharacterised protein [Brevundimonas vesicularis]